MSKLRISSLPREVDAPPIPSTPVKGYTPEQWRAMLAAPLDARFDDGTGTYCPMDDTLLRVRLDGWNCTTCRGAWDFRGLSGRWLPLLHAVEMSGVPTPAQQPAPHEQTGVAPMTVVDNGATLAAQDQRVARDLKLRQLDRRLATAIGVGFGGALALDAGLQLQLFSEAVPTELILAVALVLVLVAGAIVAWAWLAGHVERARYAGNKIIATYDIDAPATTYQQRMGRELSSPPGRDDDQAPQSRPPMGAWDLDAMPVLVASGMEGAR